MIRSIVINLPNDFRLWDFFPFFATTDNEIRFFFLFWCEYCAQLHVISICTILFESRRRSISHWLIFTPQPTFSPLSREMCSMIRFFYSIQQPFMKKFFFHSFRSSNDWLMCISLIFFVIIGFGLMLFFDLIRISINFWIICKDTDLTSYGIFMSYKLNKS